MSRYKLNNLVLGKVPLVVGTISTTDALVLSKEKYICDVIEVRLDELDITHIDWLQSCRKIESSGFPVIATLRFKSDGGKWAGTDEERKPILSEAIQNLSIIDIEANSVLMQDMCLLAESLEKPIIVSYHNFEKTNDITELSDIISRIREFPNAIPKLATMVESERDLDVLTELLDMYKELPLCIIGMGAKGAKTRTVFPAVGSALTYGYIDSSVAPGQLCVSDLVEYLMANNAEYNQFRTDRDKQK